MPKTEPEVAILGAGPIGIEAALALAERGLPFTLYEAADRVAAHLRSWGHVRLFSPWSLDVSPRMRHWLEKGGVEAPAGDDCPTGDELAALVFEPLAAMEPLASSLALGTRVLAVGRQGLLKHEEIGTGARAERPFRLLCADREGRERVATADVVLDCTGSYGRPNPVGDGGIPAPGERSLDGAIAHRIPDLATEAAEWRGRTVLLVGAGHSAQTAVVELAELAGRGSAETAGEKTGTRVIWALRSERPSWPIDPEDPLPERARLTRRARALAEGASPAVEAIFGVVVEGLERDGGRVRVTLRATDGARRRVTVDRVLALTGSVGDHLLYRELQVHECYATSGPMKLAAALLGESSADCLAQKSHGPETLVNPEPGFYILGAKSYGRNNTFLMRTGWQQVDEVVGGLLGLPG